MKGLGMASIPSMGQIRTTEVPLHTTRPNALVSSNNLYGSSGSANKTLKLIFNYNPIRINCKKPFRYQFYYIYQLNRKS